MATKIKMLHLIVYDFSILFDVVGRIGAICTSISNFLLCFYTDVNFALQYVQSYMSQLEFQSESATGKENGM